VSDFLRTNGAWIVNELERIERLRSIRRPKRQAGGAILYRGELTPVRVDEDRNRGGANNVMFNDRQLVILRSTTSRTAPSVSLENWLRSRRARKSFFTSTC
jgi:predicted metal-dependent hydrolase